MSKARKKVFPKPPQRLNSKTAEQLGKNSNSMKEFYHAALYNRPTPSVPLKNGLNEAQQKMLANLKKNLNKGN